MVRHPCERVLSWAWHYKALRKRDDPVARVIELGSAQPSPNLPYLFRDPALAVVIRHEHLTDDLADLSQRPGIDLVAHLPVTKGGNRASRTGAADLLSADRKARIRARDRAFFDACGYRP